MVSLATRYSLEDKARLGPRMMPAPPHRYTLTSPCRVQLRPSEPVPCRVLQSHVTVADSRVPVRSLWLPPSVSGMFRADGDTSHFQLYRGAWRNSRSPHVDLSCVRM